MKAFSSRPLLLYSYLATEMLAPFFASFLVINGIFILVKIIPFLDTVLDMEIGVGDFIRSFSYLFPNIFLYTIPISAMMGIIISFSRMSSDLEILAFKSGGIGIYRIIPPVFVVATLLAVLTSYFSTTLIPAGENAMKQLMYQLAKEKIDKGIKEDQFTVSLGELVVYVKEIDKKSNLWKEIWVSDMRDQKTPIITMARSGRMITDMNEMQITLLLENGSMHTSQKSQSQIVTFDHYTIHIPLQLPKFKASHDKPKRMTMQELVDYVEQYGTEDKKGRDSIIQYHKRLALPFGCLVLTLLGLPLGLQSGPGKRAIGIPLGLAFFILYYIFYILGKRVAEETALPVFLPMWGANFVFLLLTFIFIYRVANEKPLLPEQFRYKLTDYAIACKYVFLSRKSQNKSS